MRLEYRIELDKIDVPRFSVEAVEGIGKVFTLATLVLNVLETKRSVDLVFHGLNPEDSKDGNEIGKDGYTNLEIYLNSLVKSNRPNL